MGRSWDAWRGPVAGERREPGVREQQDCPGETCLRAGLFGSLSPPSGFHYLKGLSRLAVHDICLKRLVGERGFEPPTPWSRTRFQSLLKSVEFC